MKTSECDLLGLLSNNDVTFFIPPYQRNYEWTEEQCQIFLDDIIKTYESNINDNLSKHFFGTVTYFQNDVIFGQPAKLVLIDGQQRITTTMLFLVALRDTLEDENLKNFIDAKYLKNSNVPGDTEYKIKLKQVETDWIAYKKIILSEPLEEKEKDSAVYSNYSFFINELDKLKSKNIQFDLLIQKGASQFTVVTVELQPRINPWEKPQEIFESMNSLGKPLSLADLVRNYLLLELNADTQDQYYKDYWLKIEKAIPKKVSDLIRDYMQLKEKKAFPKATDTNHKKLYRMFKNKYYDVDVKTILEELAFLSRIYSYIVLGEDSGSVKINRILNDLRRLNVTTAYSFLMSVLNEWKKGEFSEDDVCDILQSFSIYCYRRRLIYGLTSAENKSFPLLTNCIDKLKKSDNKKEDMFKVLSRQENALRLPNDIELTRVLDTLNFYNLKYCKFFLAMIEEKITKSRPDLNDSKLQIEHIMPQTLNDEWRVALGEDWESVHQQYVHTIGNLTLIRHNQELGQKSFIAKKEIYENNAGLQIARTKITDKSEWNKESIQDRKDWIVNFLLHEVFPIPDSMRNTNNFISKDGRRLSFHELQIIGYNINFIGDNSIVAKVVDDRSVEFEGKIWKLSPLTKEIMSRKGKVNKSGAYQGAQYWEFDGMKLADII